MAVTEQLAVTEQRAPPSRKNEQQNDRGGYNSEREMQIEIWNERTNTIHIDPRAASLTTKEHVSCQQNDQKGGTAGRTNSRLGAGCESCTA